MLGDLPLFFGVFFCWKNEESHSSSYAKYYLKASLPLPTLAGQKFVMRLNVAQRDAGASSSIMLLSVGVQVFTTCYWD